MYKSIKKKKNVCASLEAQWWIICLPMQQTRVRSPVQEDPTCHKATETVNHKYWACALGPGSHKTAAPTSCNSSSVFAPQEKPPHWEAVCIRNTVAPSSLQPERSPPSNKDPAKPRINKSTFKRLAKSIKCWKKNDVSEHVFVCVCVCVWREREVSLFAVQQKLPQSTIGSVQSLSPARLFVTWRTAARQASLSITNSQSLLKLLIMESVMPSNHLVLCHPLLLPPSIFPSIRVFSSE